MFPQRNALRRRMFRNTMTVDLAGANAMSSKARLALICTGGIIAGCSEPAHEAPAPPAAEAPPRSADAAAPLEEPGWTGLTEPEEVIEARRVLMLETERLMMPIDGFTIGEAADPDILREYARSIEAMLLALPHLFPPTTNRYDPSTIESPTIALPAIWESFDAFLAQAETAEMAAAAVIAVTDDESLRAAGMQLRAACDACHAAYTKPYIPPKPIPEDFEFDFESALPDK
jgi:cytochrome c556